MEQQQSVSIDTLKQAQLAAAVEFNAHNYQPPTYIQNITEAQEEYQKKITEAISFQLNTNYEPYCQSEYDKASKREKICMVGTIGLGTTTTLLIAATLSTETSRDLKMLLIACATLSAFGTGCFVEEDLYCSRYKKIMKPIAEQSKQRE